MPPYFFLSRIFSLSLGSLILLAEEVTGRWYFSSFRDMIERMSSSFYFSSFLVSMGVSTPNFSRYFSCHFLRCYFLRLTISAYRASRYSRIENFLLSSMEILMGSLQTIYYSSSWKSLTYLCLRACYAVYLLLGLKTRRCLRRSSAYYDAPGKKL
jgi:hypothetical protein